MTTNRIFRDAATEERIERLTHRFPELRTGEAQRALAAGTALARIWKAIALWGRRRRAGVVTLYVLSGRA